MAPNIEQQSSDSLKLVTNSERQKRLDGTHQLRAHARDIFVLCKPRIWFEQRIPQLDDED